MELKRRRRITRGIVLAGLMASAIVVGSGKVEARRAERKIKALELKCEDYRRIATSRPTFDKVAREEWLREHPNKAGLWPKLPLGWTYHTPPEESFPPRVELTTPEGHVFAFEAKSEKKPEEAQAQVNDIISQHQGGARIGTDSCSAEEISKHDYDSENMLTETQKQLRSAYVDRERKDKLFDLALWPAALAALPWFWYFVLDRVRELSAAIRGKAE